MNRPSSLRAYRYRNALLQGGASKAGLVIVLLVIVLAVLRFVAPGVLSTVTTPVWRVGSNITAYFNKVSPADSKESVQKERDSLSEQNISLTAQNALLTSQVADLTRLLGTRAQPSKGVIAAIVARPPVAPYDVLILDQGSNAGVELGALVEGQGGTPVGTVGKVDANQSRVTLYSTHGIRTNGWVGSERIPVMLTGVGAGAFRAELPKSAAVAIGDGVYIPGNGAFPIGTIVNVEADPSSPTVELDVRPYTNPFSLTWVTVISQ